MGTRIRLGLTFSHDEGWIGGTYYFLNLIYALNTLEDAVKPHLIILSRREKDFESIKQIGYPYISYRNYTLPRPSKSQFIKVINKISLILWKDSLVKVKPLDEKIDVLFGGSFGEYYRKIPQHLFWIPDFQENYYPEFFENTEVKNRKRKQHKIASKGKYVIFSSEDSLLDFKKLYPFSKIKTFVLNFAVTHPEYSSLDIDMLKDKYNIKGQYFFCPNQFWKHKNHQVVLDALVRLKTSNKISFIVVFTGKESDYRNDDYAPSLKRFVQENSLEDNVKFLGFIDREDQLQLMNHAEAIIQPSLFEGWSTVVEDAKSMNQNLIVSNLSIHREQLMDKGYFFDPRDSEKLAKYLITFSEKKVERPSFEYDKRIHKFGKKFIEIIDTLKKDF